MIEIINTLFTDTELSVLHKEVDIGQWNLTGFSSISPYMFWCKDIETPPALNLFKEKIEQGIHRKIIIDRLYVNGQAHSQCGFWHTDAKPGSNNHFTIVYFFQEWKPEYGGHLLIKTDTVTSILPEFNKAVLFDSTFEHMGMEPTVHCKTQRESIACKFRVIDV